MYASTNLCLRAYRYSRDLYGSKQRSGNIIVPPLIRRVENKHYGETF